jgi:fibronectin type 3 domain-containing protein
MNGNCLIRLRIKVFTGLLLLLLSAITSTEAQVDSLKFLDPIQVVGRPSGDSIVLRWAPLETRYWLAANKHGYILERYTLVRDGKSLSQPEKKILTETPVKPYDEARWIPIVQNNKFAAIAAQALLGDKFELDMKQGGDAFSIVNKVKENDQRFSIALFCADLSVPTAKALGLYFADRDVKKGEKYLYRIISAEANGKVMRGSIYIAANDTYVLPAPKQFSLELQGNIVQLKWDQTSHKRIYTAYILERSSDGKNFKALSEDPVTTLSNQGQDNKYAYAIDTLMDLSKVYYYRLKGITPFGELGLPSDSLTAKGKQSITEVPHITSAESSDNRTIKVNWEFPQELNKAVEGFYVERSPSHSGNYKRLHEKLLPGEVRSFNDQSPEQTNYYRITALSLDKEQIRSMIYFTHLIDSFPPVAPVGIKGIIDNQGNVTLSWKPNTEKDIYGYRVYRANYLNEEFAQLTSAPVQEVQFNDNVQLKTLNEKIHYRVMAIDKNQNHSVLSEIYTIQLPDKVAPMSPVFLPVRSSEEGVELRWIPSSSTDVVKYEIFRKGESGQWIRITAVPVGNDSIYQFKDVTLANGEERHYVVVAIDEAGLESLPTQAVKGQRIRRSVYPAIVLGEPQLDREHNKVLLKWAYTEQNVTIYQVYKSINDGPIKLYRTVSANEFADTILPGKKYLYKVVAVFKDGARSQMGEGVLLAY